MAELDDLLGRLKVFWAAQGLACGQVASPEAIASFELRYGVSLPVELREYFLVINGMASTSDESPADDNDISFYPLDRVMPDENVTGGHGRLFTLADFLVSSYEYAVELAPAGQESGTIYALAGGNLILTGSFGHFLGRYIASDPAILYPWGTRGSCGAG